jgi:hypothetical protein
MLEIAEGYDGLARREAERQRVRSKAWSRIGSREILGPLKVLSSLFGFPHSEIAGERASVVVRQYSPQNNFALL